MKVENDFKEEAECAEEIYPAELENVFDNDKNKTKRTVTKRITKVAKTSKKT
jgi:hypothetical protein